MNLGIVGSRDYDSDEFYEYMSSQIKEFLREKDLQIDDIECVISGGAKGVDSMAARWAKENKVAIKVYEADWKKYGKVAGPIRNALIVENSSHVLAFPSKTGSGTQDTIRKCKMYKKYVKEFNF